MRRPADLRGSAAGWGIPFFRFFGRFPFLLTNGPGEYIIKEAEKARAGFGKEIPADCPRPQGSDGCPLSVLR